MAQVRTVVLGAADCRELRECRRRTLSLSPAVCLQKDLARDVVAESSRAYALVAVSSRNLLPLSVGQSSACWSV